MMYCQSVHNYHLDGYGHVNNARYLEFLEAARWHFFTEKNLNTALRQAKLVVAHMDIRYRRAASLDDQLHIHTQVIAVQSRQIQMKQRIECHKGVCVQAHITLMPTDAEGRVFRLPESLYQACHQLITL